MTEHRGSDPRKAVLLVEDDPAQQTLVGDVLRSAGFAVCVADGQAAALAALGDPALQLVLSDFKLSDGDGLTDEGAGHGTMVAGILHLLAPDAQLLPGHVGPLRRAPLQPPGRRPDTALDHEAR